MNAVVSARHGARASLAFAITFALAAAAGAASAQTVPAPGLKAAGTISYDAEGVPTVTAASDEDAAWLMGYAHARDRFFQMDLLRRTGSGTLAELVGAPALSQDVEIRTLGLRRAAWATWSEISDELRTQLKAYADGVNAWLAQNDVPLEHQALELSSADPWTPVDSLVIGKLLAFQLSFDLDIDATIRYQAYQQAGAAAGFDGNALFFEDTHRSQPADDRVSIPDWSPTGTVGASAESAAKFAMNEALVDPRAVALAKRYRDRVADNPVLAKQLERKEGIAGSNWWVVAGEHTESGAPILANDPHLSLDTPMLFHEGHVVSHDPRYDQPMNSVGAIAPGTPWPILGCTADFCWGLTTNSLDVTDTYLEQFRLNTYGLPTHTVHEDGVDPVLWVFQSYFVNATGDGVADNLAREASIGYTNGGVTILVPRRNNGPVLNIDGDTGLSAAYAGWGATRELDAFRLVNRATNLDEFREALTFFDVGSQNFAYADQNDIAYFTTAEAPIREDLQNNTVSGAPPFLIRNGYDGNDWLPATTHYPNQSLPFEILGPGEMPFTINPEQGYIVNANNDPVGHTLDNNAFNQLRPGGGLYYLAPGHGSYRVGRIDRLISDRIASGEKITRADMQAWQANNQPLDAELVLPHLQAAFDNASADSGSCRADLAADPAVAEAMAYLNDWDFTTPTGIQQGYDPGDNPFALAPPSESEIANSVAATIWALFRGQVIRNTMDATLASVGLGDYQPGSGEAYVGLKHLLDTFDASQGVGASGLDFFANVPASAQGESAERRRDCVLLASLKGGLDLAASDAFAPAFGNSTDLSDYRWGRLHRIVFDHPLGAQLSIPGENPYPFQHVDEGLPGLARPGGYEVLDASGHNTRANTVNGFMFGGGPVRRFVGEMTDEPTLLQIMPGGQDGKIGGPGYISQLPRWLVNAYKPLVIDPAQSQAGTVATIQFAPPN